MTNSILERKEKNEITLNKKHDIQDHPSLLNPALNNQNFQTCIGVFIWD